jgi:hypothetical protein
MSTPKPEINELFAGRGENHARRLRRDQRLKVKAAERGRGA